MTELLAGVGVIDAVQTAGLAAVVGWFMFRLEGILKQNARALDGHSRAMNRLTAAIMRLLDRKMPDVASELSAELRLLDQEMSAGDA